MSGRAVHLHVKVPCGCSHSGKARSQSAVGGKRKAQANVNLTPTEEKTTAKRRHASNFKREAQSSNEGSVSADERSGLTGLMMRLLLLFIYTTILNFDHCLYPVCNQGVVVMNVVDAFFLQSLNP